jgi:hypothetical protein
VRIEQLQPVERVGRRPAGAGAAGVAPPGSTPAGSQRNGLAPNSDPAAADAAQPRDTSVGYRIVATASYGSLVEFLRRLPGELGFTVLKSVRVQPGDSEHPDLARVQVETEHLAFDVGELANLTVAPGVGATRTARVGDDAAEGGR